MAQVLQHLHNQILLAGDVQQWQYMRVMVNQTLRL